MVPEALNNAPDGEARIGVREVSAPELISRARSWGQIRRLASVKLGKFDNDGAWARGSHEVPRGASTARLLGSVHK